jgi:hypothetical protein
MKKSIIFLGLMMVSAFIFGQRKADPMERAAKQADKMKTELSLDEVQYKSVRAIHEEFAEKVSALRKDSSLSKQAKRDGVKVLHAEKEVAIGKVLTEEQKLKWQSYQREQKKNRRSSLTKESGEHAQHMQKSLSLTDEQTSSLKAIDKEYAQKFRALKKESAMVRESIRQRAQILREEYLSKTKSILTEDQFKQWELQRTERKRKKLGQKSSPDSELSYC